MKILVTGTAGFIGYHLAEKLAARGDEIVGIDNINDYYDVNLKYARLNESGFTRDAVSNNVMASSLKYPHYRFIKLDLLDRGALSSLFESEKFDAVCHLAAQPGVRYSLKNPYAYIDSNIYGFMNVLEECRRHAIGHLVFASSSSVYGLNKKMPFGTSDNVDHPISLYGASKKCNELMAHAYSYLFKIPSTGLRFFTVYGPWGRPDMAPFLFARSILDGNPIDVFNQGNMERDFTFIDDIVEGVVKVIDKPPVENPSWDSLSPDPGSSAAPYKIYNIGNSMPVKLLDFISCLEKALGKNVVKNYFPLQPGDVPATYADVNDLMRDLHYRPSTPLQKGIGSFVQWFKNYYCR